MAVLHQLFLLSRAGRMRFDAISVQEGAECIDWIAALVVLDVECCRGV